MFVGARQPSVTAPAWQCKDALQGSTLLQRPGWSWGGWALGNGRALHIDSQAATKLECLAV